MSSEGILKMWHERNTNATELRSVWQCLRCRKTETGM